MKYIDMLNKKGDLNRMNKKINVDKMIRRW